MNTRLNTPLQEKAEAALRADWLLKDFPIEIFDDNGILILQGSVPSKAIALLIEDVVQKVDGVVGITNALYIQTR
jgi:osmotically-inducible protein OsmY